MTFTIVLPCRDTHEEKEFLHKSLPAAIKLNPGEIIMAVDAPVSGLFHDEIMALASANNYHNLKIVAVEKTSDWNFQLAKIVWACYREVKYDAIYSFDVDSIPTKHVLEGLAQIGKDGVAVYSFTKRLRLKNLPDIIRYFFYRYRVWTTDYVFTGNYYIWRPFFYDIVVESEYRKIINGVDAYLTEKLIKVGAWW